MLKQSSNSLTPQVSLLHDSLQMPSKRPNANQNAGLTSCAFLLQDQSLSNGFETDMNRTEGT